MGAPHWPEAVDPLVEGARFGPGDSFWDSAERAVAAGLPDETLRYLATVGLTELVTQVHRIERNRHDLCIGDELVISRHPELEPWVTGSKEVDE